MELVGSDSISIRALPGHAVIVSKDSRVYCQHNKVSGEFKVYEISDMVTQSIAQGVLSGKPECFLVDDDLENIFFRTSDGLFMGRVPQVNSSMVLSKLDIPTDWPEETVRVLAVAGPVALVSAFREMALISTNQTEILASRIAAPYPLAFSRGDWIFYTPAADADLQMLLTRRSAEGTFAGPKLRGFNSGGPGMPYLRLVAGSSDHSVVAGVVESVETTGAPQSPACFVWLSGVLLDVNRSEEFKKSAAIAVYDDKLVCLFENASEKDTPRTIQAVQWSLSSKEGFTKRVSLSFDVSPTAGSVSLHPHKPIAVIHDEQHESIVLRFLKLGKDSAK